MSNKQGYTWDNDSDKLSDAIPMGEMLKNKVTAIDASVTAATAVLPTADEKAALDGAASPSASNVFATMADVGGGSALQFNGTITSSGASLSTHPGENVFIFDGSGTNIEFFLDVAPGITGDTVLYFFKNIDTISTVILKDTGAAMIDGASARYMVAPNSYLILAAINNTYNIVARGYDNFYGVVQYASNSDLSIAPNTGEKCLVLAPSTDGFATRDGNIATYNGTSWDFEEPKDGVIAFVRNMIGAVFIKNSSDWITVDSAFCTSSDISASVTLDQHSFETQLVDATAGAVTVTLPPVASSMFKKFTIKKIDSSVNAVIIQANGAETIDGANTLTISAQYGLYTIQCNGSYWSIISQI